MWPMFDRIEIHLDISIMYDIQLNREIWLAKIAYYSNLGSSRHFEAKLF